MIQNYPIKYLFLCFAFASVFSFADEFIFRDAVRHGQANIVKEMLDSGEMVLNDANNWGSAYITMATNFGHENVVAAIQRHQFAAAVQHAANVVANRAPKPKRAENSAARRERYRKDVSELLLSNQWREIIEQMARAVPNYIHQAPSLADNTPDAPLAPGQWEFHFEGPGMPATQRGASSRTTTWNFASGPDFR